MDEVFGYNLNDGIWFFELNEKQQERFQACVDMADKHWTIVYSSYMNNIPKSTLHEFIHRDLKDLSEQLYLAVLKQINWNIHHHRRNM